MRGEYSKSWDLGKRGVSQPDPAKLAVSASCLNQVGAASLTQTVIRRKNLFAISRLCGPAVKKFDPHSFPNRASEVKCAIEPKHQHQVQQIGVKLLGSEQLTGGGFSACFPECDRPTQQQQ